ncbi:MAG: hypothetical protein ABJJ44_18055 [Paraglaciecola sp.]|uniref:hypothetical protein n=1 Tax=Paraglaciecola sp. TaxID=1920173 RepID=UPI0032988008
MVNLRVIGLIFILLCISQHIDASSLEGFALKYENKLDIEVKVEVSSYFSPNFDKNKPSTFTDSLFEKKEVVTLTPNESRKVMYYTSIGYWIRWRVIEPQSLSNISGLLEPLINKRYLVVE